MTKMIKAVAFLVVLVLSAPTWALTINGGATDVGDVDTILDSAALSSSGEAVEKAWVESVLGFSVTFETKIDGAFSWEAVDGQVGVYAQELLTDPSYYLVKTGAGSSTGHTHFLYDNMASLSYAVIDLADMGFDTSKIGITKVSHISEFEGGDTPPEEPPMDVPEPGLLVLMAIGLLGLRFFSARRA